MKTVIFDLDETLVHYNEILNQKSDVYLDITINEDIISVFLNFIFSKEKTYIKKVGINIRPYAKEILKDLSRDFELVVFTASHFSYANAIIDFLDPSQNLFKKRLYRDHCVLTEEGLLIKDLTIFKDRSLENIVLIDNSLYSYCFQLENGIPIIPFYNNKLDMELLSLRNYLKGLKNASDVRKINREVFKYDFFKNVKELDCLLDVMFDDIKIKNTI